MGDQPADRARRLRIDVTEAQRDCWVVPLLAEVASGRGWSIVGGDPGQSDAIALLRSVGDALAPVDEPAFIVAVEAGTPRSPIVVESAAHEVARFDLVLGEFKARRNQEVTRGAIDRFLARVEDAPSETASETAYAPAAVIEAGRTLLAAVDAWLARSTTTAEVARSIHADRAILDAAIGAPVIDLVIVERASTRLALRIGH